MKKLIIDTDPGIDDAVALSTILFAENFETELITTVAGNVNIDKVTNNLKKLLTFLNKENIKIARGIERPLVKKLDDASVIHGESGLDGFDFKKSDIKELPVNAVNAMYDLLKNSSEKITILALGPLTNIAILIRMYPEVINRIERIVFMGGSFTRGNKTIMAEFNIFVDPEAAKIVFDSEIPKVMIGLDIGWKTRISHEIALEIKNSNKVGEMIYSLFKAYRGSTFEKGLTMYDSTAVAYLMKPEMFITKDVFVDVELEGKYSKGTTVVDLELTTDNKPNVTVAIDIDQHEFNLWFKNSLKRCNI